uniref:Uncharacterized protein n=1 Tax=Marmota marmota marmota TaxID=9994 RepID=A0A8C5ZRX4_MARMA
IGEKIAYERWHKSQSKELERLLPPLGPVAIDPKGYVTIAIHTKPSSKQMDETNLTTKVIKEATAG